MKCAALADTGHWRGRWIAVLVALPALLLGAGLLPGCGSARRGVPVDEPVVLGDAGLMRGRQTFAAHCYTCHPGGAAGLGPAINNKPLPGWLMRMQVRHGLGAMPAFSEDQIGDVALDELVAYLDHLQSLSPPPSADDG